jgi:GTPase
LNLVAKVKNSLKASINNKAIVRAKAVAITIPAGAADVTATASAQRASVKAETSKRVMAKNAALRASANRVVSALKVANRVKHVSHANHAANALKAVKRASRVNPVVSVNRAKTAKSLAVRAFLTVRSPRFCAAAAAASN